MELLSIVDELYALTPGQFTAARNERAKRAKADGDKELAQRIGQLRKPSLAAWVVNMLMRHDGDEMTQVLALGESLRQAQADLDGEALRELTRQRRRLTAAITGKGRSLAADLGERVSEQVAQQVEDTLHAAMIDEGAAAAVRSGALTEPLTATGLGTLNIEDAVADGTALGRTARPQKQPPAPAKAELSVVPPEEPDAQEQRQQALAEARAAVEAAAADVDTARRKLDKAAKRRSKAEARGLQIQAELDELRRRVAELEYEAEAVDGETEAAEQKRDRAADRLAGAERVLGRAQAELDRLESTEDAAGGRL